MIFPLFLLSVGILVFISLTYDMLFVKFEPKELLRSYLFILPYIALMGFFVWFIYDTMGGWIFIEY